MCESVFGREYFMYRNLVSRNIEVGERMEELFWLKGDDWGRVMSNKVREVVSSNLVLE